jgi:ABC-type glycerol-3-phosphate transport system substrate-binding protein
MLQMMGMTALATGLASCAVPIAPAAGPAPASEPLKLLWWTAPLYPGGADGTDPDAEADVYPKILAQKYQDQNPNVEVSLEVIPFADQGVQKVVAAKASGTQPNAVYMDASYDQFGNGWFIAIDSYIDEEDRADIYDWAWGMQSYQGSVYGWPWFLKRQGRWICCRPTLTVPGAGTSIWRPSRRRPSSGQMAARSTVLV